MTWTLSTEDPEALAETARPFVGDVRIRRRHAGGFRGSIDAVGLSRMALCRVRLRNALLTSRRREFMSAWLPLRGTIRLTSPSRDLNVQPGIIAVMPGRCEAAFETESADLLFAGFGDDFVATVARTMNGRGGDLGVVDLLPANAAWTASYRRYLQYVWSEVSQSTPGILTSDLVLRACEDALLASLFLVNRNVSITGSAVDMRPAYLRRAIDHINANPGEAFSLAELCRVAGVSASTLSRAFRKHHGCGPVGFAKQRRLERAQQDLTVAPPDSGTVTNIATKYGFFHLAQFAADYRRAFGERPSETLRRM